MVQRISKPQLCFLVVHHTVSLLLLMDIMTGQTQTVSPSQTIITLVGEDIMLPCRLEPPSDAVSKSLEWGRLDLDPRFVHVWYEGQNHLVNQNPSYKGRTSLSTEKLKQGDLSLKLSRVKHSDNGRYRCYFPSEPKESVVELIVGSLSSPTIAGININRSAVVLQCESAGWYPEPELLWVDGEGNLLPAGPSETLRGADDLYTVSSRVTVEKRHNNNFTCRVQQKNINQSRETHIHVSGDCAAVPPSPAVRVSIILAVCLIFICAAAFAVWKWRQNKSRETKWHTEGKKKEQLMAEREKSDELQQKEEELKDVEELINILMEQENELLKMKEELKHQCEMMDGELEDVDKELQSVDKKTESDRVNGYLALKEMVNKGKNKLSEKKHTHATLQTHTEKLLMRTQKEIIKMQHKKTEVEKQKEKISLQLAETQKEIQEKPRLEERQETLNI